uniref:Uncharacterized protein n=1 Tax=Salmonella sp. TaxID=599 RepID=A0A482ETW3_SALSP|nr:hypothetical protein NNIBIDOC_00167 [Salmonella sp.]
MKRCSLSTKLAKDNGKIDKLRDQLTKARKLSDAQKKRRRQRSGLQT